MIRFFNITFLLSLVVLIASCSNKENRTLEESASAFIQNNNQVILFGSLDVMSVLEKADYSAIPKFGGIIESQVKRMKSGLNLEKGFYFAMEGPFEGGNPGTTYLFAEIKNLDSLKSLLTKDGYDFDHAEGIDYFRDGDATVGVMNKLAILLTKSGDYDELAAVKTAFEKTSGDLMTGSGADLLANRGDISINTHLYNQFVTANKYTVDMPKDKKEQLAAMMTGSFSQANVYFEKGQLRIAMDNKLSANLSKRLMLNEDASASIRANMGSGEPKMAIATNLDLEKMQAWMDDFAPGALESFLEKDGGPLQMAMMLGGGKMSNLLNGKMGFAMFGDPKAGAMVPDFTFYAGFGPNGKPMAEMAQNFLKGGTMQLNITEKGVSGSSSNIYTAVSGSKINVPNGCETFGKTGLSGFINLDRMDTQALELKGAGKLVELVKYLNFSITAKGGEILVKLKNQKDNVLKQSVQHMLKEFEGQIGELSF